MQFIAHGNGVMTHYRRAGQPRAPCTTPGGTRRATDTTTAACVIRASPVARSPTHITARLHINDCDVILSPSARVISIIRRSPRHQTFGHHAAHRPWRQPREARECQPCARRSDDDRTSASPSPNVDCASGIAPGCAAYRRSPPTRASAYSPRPPAAATRTQRGQARQFCATSIRGRRAVSSACEHAAR